MLHVTTVAATTAATTTKKKTTAVVSNHLIRRTVSTSIAHLPRFPPKEFLKNAPSDTKGTPLPSPETWGSLQPPPPSALSAFAHRIGLGTILTDTSIIQQACTHSSFVPLYQRYYPDQPSPPCNTSFATLGNALLGLFAAEHLHAIYPHLPTRVLKAAVSAHVGPNTCASIAHEMGATRLLRWHRLASTPTKVDIHYDGVHHSSVLPKSVLHNEALASIPRAIVALIYKHRCLLSARKFTETFFLSREIDLRSMLKFTDPKRVLLHTVAKFERERPKSRLLKETGRYSNSPIFVVGIYSGADQLGEGFGSSLKMAEFRAAEDALHRLYLTRTPPHLLRIPTSTFPPTMGNVYHDMHRAGAYVPGELGEAEVLYGSSGRSGVVLPQPPKTKPSVKKS